MAVFVLGIKKNRLSAGEIISIHGIIPVLFIGIENCTHETYFVVLTYHFSHFDDNFSLKFTFLKFL